MERERDMDFEDSVCEICGGSGCQNCLSPEEFERRMAEEIAKKKDKESATETGEDGSEEAENKEE
jgi:hypothetical protein